MIRNQIGHNTKYDRYPDIFKYFKSDNIIKVLSFGCSTGEECRVLSEKYVPNAEITGVDIDSSIINDNNIKNKNDKIRYFDTIPINTTFDITFCMSVLCVWPPNIPQYKFYSFDKFEQTVNIIDKVVKPGGYLVIYNSSFCFTETSIFKNYNIANNVPSLEQFVTKKTKLGTIVNENIFIFQKKIIS